MISALVALSVAATSAGPCKTIHGSMDLWNGTPTVRIQVIGTHRVLGVVQPNERLDDLPSSVRRFWTGKDAEADWKTSIVGDFAVCPVAAERPGRMRMVRLVDARRLTTRRRQDPHPVGGGGRPETRAASPSL